MAQSFELMEQTLQRAGDMMNQQKYDIAKNLLTEALGQFALFKRQIPSGSDYDEVERSIRLELAQIEQIQKELRRIRTQPSTNIDFDQYSDDQDFSNQKPTYQKKQQYQPQKPKINQNNNQNINQNINQNQNKNFNQKYETPWKQKPIIKKTDNSKEQKNDFSINYENIEPRFAEEIHAIMIKETGVTYDDVAGLDDVKRLLDEAIIYPMKMPELFSKIQAWRGVLLYGPPGTGKTEIAKAVATKARCCFFAASASTIMSKYVGESEKIVKALFTIARFHAPSIIFLDEIDAIMSTGSSSNDNPVGPRLRQELLTQMQGVGTDSQKQVLVLAATNHPWNLDEAMRRRLEKRIYLPLPEQISRLRILKIKLKDQQLEDNVDLEQIAIFLEGYSGADIDIIVREARMWPIRRIGFDELYKNKDKYTQEGLKVSKEDFEKAIQSTKPSVSPSDLGRYEKFSKELGSV